jgi:hypothetical protein
LKDHKIWNAVNWPNRVHQWLLSNDHPSDVASVSFEIHVPDGTLGAANGELLEGNLQTGSGLDADGLRIFRWEQEKAIPAYGINIVAGKFAIYENRLCFNYDHINQDPVDCETAQVNFPFLSLDNGVAHGPHLFNSARSVIFYSSLLGLYPFSKIGFADVPHPFYMEYPSLIAGWGEATHELAHHWWGDTVFIKSWGDIWISEGLTTYFDSLYRNFLKGNGLTVSGQTGTPPAYPINKPEDSEPYFGGYEAEYAIRDFRLRVKKFLGDDESAAQAEVKVFLSLFRNLYQSYQLKNLGTMELVAFLNEHLCSALKTVKKCPDRNVVHQLVKEWQETYFKEY